MNNYIKWWLGIVSGALLILLIFTIFNVKPSKLTSTEPINTASPTATMSICVLHVEP
jgi:hypothetical protein